jgi:hypothetical protein
MENLLSFLAAVFSLNTETRGPSQINIGAPGCTLTVHKPPVIHSIKTEEGYPAWIGQSEEKASRFGFATILLPQPADDEEEMKHLLYKFLDDVHQSFDIVCGIGLTYGYDHPGDPSIFGFCEYWQDRLGHDWKVKAWSNGLLMTVLYISNIGVVSLKDQETYLDGISFSAAPKLLQ